MSMEELFFATWYIWFPFSLSLSRWFLFLPPHLEFCAETGWNWSSRSITCVFMAVVKAHLWKSLALFTRSYIPFSKTERNHSWPYRQSIRGGWCFSLAQIKMLLCPFAFHVVRWSWQWPPSCPIGLWTKSWMRCHTAITNWWVLCPSGVGLRLWSSVTAGQAPGWGGASFPHLTPLQLSGPWSYFSSPTLLPDDSRTSPEEMEGARRSDGLEKFGCAFITQVKSFVKK